MRKKTLLSCWRNDLTFRKKLEGALLDILKTEGNYRYQ